MQATVVVHGVPYVKGGCSLATGGDFCTMITDPFFDDTLFVFNDNVQDGAEHTNPMPGSGSANIRPYTTEAKGRRAVGVPTGWMAGVPFVSLDDQAKMCIDMAFERINTVLSLSTYTRVAFPCDPDDRSRIGAATFSLPEDVVSYISRKLSKIPRRAAFDEIMPLRLIDLFAPHWVSNRLRAELTRRQEEHRRRRLAATPSLSQFQVAVPPLAASVTPDGWVSPHKFPRGTLDHLVTGKRQFDQMAGASSQSTSRFFGQGYARH